jgi:hypothetical protein
MSPPGSAGLFAGAKKVLLISGSEVGRRVAQHQNAIDAAKDAGVRLLVYTSIANADRTDMQLAAEHQATERALADSDLGVARGDLPVTLSRLIGRPTTSMAEAVRAVVNLAGNGA